MNLNIEKTEAKKLFPECPEWFQKILKENFGENVFKKRSWNEITTYEIACEECPVDDDDKIYDTDAPHIVSLKKLDHITKVVNGDWKADIYNTNQKKWYQIFKVLASGSGFDFAGSVSVCDISYSGVGSRLSCETEEKSDFIGKQYLDLFKSIIIKK